MMISNANDTLTFRNAIKSYEQFISSDVAKETIAAFEVYGDGETPIEPSIWTKEVYRLLFRRYKSWEIANLHVSDFLDLLWEKIEVHTPNYFERKSRYAQLLKMSDIELLTQSKVISNYVEHTDVRTSKPLEKELENISNQSASQTYGDYSGRLRSQIYNAQMTLLEDFLLKFKTLFIRATTKSEYFA